MSTPSFLHRCAALLLACMTFGSSALAQDSDRRETSEVVSLFGDFAVAKEHARCVEALKELPADIVLSRLIHRIDTDPEWRVEPWVLKAAYRLLLDFHSVEGVTSAQHGPTTGKEPDRYEHLEQIEALLNGLVREEPAIQVMCSEAARGLEGVHAAEAVKRLSTLLIEVDPSLAASAARSLGILGKAAEPALPMLRRILVSDEERIQEYWKRIRGIDVSRRPVDHEYRIRGAAAEARVRIAGVHVDLDLYSSLDWRGLAAGSQALMPLTVELTRQAPQEDTDTSTSPAIIDAVIDLHNAVLHRDGMQYEQQSRALAMLSFLAGGERLSGPQRQKARELLRAIAEDEQSRLRTQAAKSLARLDQ